MVSEEDIKILEEFIKDIVPEYKEIDIYGEKHKINLTQIETKPTKKIAQAIENLLQGYKELKEERELIGIPVKNKIDGKIGIVLHQWKSGSVAVLEKISPRVINTHDSWNTLEIITDTVVPQTTKDDSIPKSLVEEKIEELNKKIDEAIDNSKGGLDEDFINKGTKLIAQKRVLEELLKGDK